MGATGRKHARREDKRQSTFAEASADEERQQALGVRLKEILSWKIESQKNLDKSLEIKLKGMLWDLPSGKRDILLKQIMLNPKKAFQDEKILIRGLNSLNWYDLIKLLGYKDLLLLLSESVINKMYPRQRRIFYKNAKELLSKYTLSFTS
jgi:hypothetical protein